MSIYHQHETVLDEKYKLLKVLMNIQSSCLNADSKLHMPSGTHQHLYTASLTINITYINICSYVHTYMHTYICTYIYVHTYIQYVHTCKIFHVIIKVKC